MSGLLAKVLRSTCDILHRSAWRKHGAGAWCRRWLLLMPFDGCHNAGVASGALHRALSGRSDLAGAQRLLAHLDQQQHLVRLCERIRLGLTPSAARSRTDSSVLMPSGPLLQHAALSRVRNGVRQGANRARRRREWARVRCWAGTKEEGRATGGAVHARSGFIAIGTVPVGSQEPEAGQLEQGCK